MSEEKAKEILGLNETFSDEELKKAFRIAANKTHPDVNPGIDRKKFQEVNEANKVLLDSLNKPNYELYVSQNIKNLRFKYLGSRKSTLKVYIYIDDTLNKLYKNALEYNDINRFDEEYKVVESKILDAVIKYKQGKIDLLEKEYIVNVNTKNIFEKFCNSVGIEVNIFNIENMFNDAKMKMNNYKNNISFVNKYFLDAQKSHLYKLYLGNMKYDNKIFNDEKNIIKEMIDNMFLEFSDEDTIVKYNTLYQIKRMSIDKVMSDFISKVFADMVNKSYLSKYPYASVDIFFKQMNIKKLNLDEVYKNYMDAKDSIEVSIVTNIRENLENVIIERSNIKYFNNVSDKIWNKYNHIINSININLKQDDKRDYVHELEEEIAMLIAKYGTMDIQRNKIINEAYELNIKNSIISKLANVNDFDELNRCLIDAQNLINRIKNEKQKTKQMYDKQRIISSIKGLLRLKLVSSFTYEDSKKKEISDKINDIIKKYENGELEDIKSLEKITFRNYENDLKIVNSYYGKDIYKDTLYEEKSKYKDEHKKEEVVDDFDVINDMFKKRDTSNRINIAKDIYNKLMIRYKNSSISHSFQKEEIMFKVKNILEDYINFKIDDISSLNNITFKNYMNDLDIVYDIVNTNNYFGDYKKR